MSEMDSNPPERMLLGAFFGEDRAAHFPSNPAGVLGVEAGGGKAAVVDGLQQSLAQLAAHPYGRSPEAVEVRMVLQQCASRLLDELDVAERLGVPRTAAQPPAPSTPAAQPVRLAPVQPVSALPAPAAPPKPPMPVAPRPAPAQNGHATPTATGTQPAPTSSLSAPAIVPTGLERDAARILAQSGSVEAAVRSLTALAAVRGLPPEAATQAIANLTAMTAQGGVRAAGVPAAAAPPPAAQPSIAQAPAQPRAPVTEEAESLPRRDYEAERERGYEDPSQALLRKTIFIGVGVALLCIAGVIAVIFALSRGGSTPAAPGSPAAAATGTAGGVASATGVTAATRVAGATGVIPPQGITPTNLNSGSQPPAWAATGRLASRTPEAPSTAPGTRVEADAVLQSLRRAAELAASDHASALKSFGNAAVGARNWWPTYDPSTRVAIAESIVEALYRFAASSSGALGAVDALAPTSSTGATMTADDVWPTAWSAGVLLRLSRERELPGAVVVRVQTLLTDALGPERPPGSTSFADGAALALHPMPERLLARYAPPAGPGVNAPADAEVQLARGFSLWVQAINAVRTGVPATAPEVAEDAVMDGVTQLVMHTPDSTSSRAVYKAIESVVAAERWRKDGQARIRLLAWFDDGRVSTPNLSLITQTLVQRSSADAVDITMVLSPGAGDSQRTELRDAYAKSWALEGLQPAAWLTANIRQTLDNALQSSEAPGSPMQDLRTTLLLARATQSAAGKVGGLTEAQVQITLQDLLNPLPQAKPVDIRNWEWSTQNPRSWGLDYLAGDRTLAYRIDRLGLLDNLFQLSIMEAEVLAEACFTAPQPELRAAARTAAIRCQDQWSVIYGLLQALPRMARTDSNLRFVGQMTQRALSPASSAEWAHDARRAAIERLLELLLDPASDTNADRLAAQLAESLSSMTGKATPADQINDEDAGQAALLAVRKLFQASRAEAGKHVPNEKAPVRLDQIDRRRASRLAAAVGPIQQFAAEQVSATEALAYAVSGEVPADAPRVRAIIDTMQRERRSATHVFAQTKAAQRAQVRLWLVRLDRANGGTTPAPAPAQPADGASPGASPTPVRVGAHGPGAGNGIDYSSVRVPNLPARLSALSPADPMGYFMLAEEVAAEARDRTSRDLARRLYLLAFVLDQPGVSVAGGVTRRGELGPSVCLGLAALTTREGERRWLAATAAVVETDLAGLGGASTPTPRETMIVDDQTGLQLATLIGAVRGGDGRRAQSLLKKPAVSRALDAYASVLEDRGTFGMAGQIRMRAENYLSCPECKNKRVVTRIERPGEPARPMICPVCHGVPGPVMTQSDLLTQLSMESALLRGIHRLWSSQSLSDSGEPLRDPSPDELSAWYGLDAARSVYRDGQWVEPPAAPGAANGG